MSPSPSASDGGNEQNVGRTYERAYASLRLMAVELDPSQITRELLLPPDHVHRNGDLRIQRNRYGGVSQYAPYRAGHWSMSSKSWVMSPRLQVHIEWILREIEPKKDALRGILARDVEGDIFCFSSGKTTAPPALRGSLSKAAEDLGLPIVIDHYDISDDDYEVIEFVHPQ